MDNFFLLIAIGFLVGMLGTLIGAGGGFLLVPLLIIMYPKLTPDIITAVSIAIVACNAISGSVAYSRSGRIDFKAGLVFAFFTIPGSILGVIVTKYIPSQVFHIVFGAILIMLAILLFFKKRPQHEHKTDHSNLPSGWKHHSLTDRTGCNYDYSYNQTKGILISIVVGFISPILGIGGGIIHVPAMVNILYFPVYVATATSHFILAIMSTVSVIVHAIQGSYDSAYILRMVIGLCLGVIPGAQVGAFISHKIKGKTIIRALAVCIGIVGIRILLGSS
ncbi:MAG: sulfite exporter TauE/SafE family protein [Ilyomonas sp.]